ncbi:MAG: tetratricopeptide repeat protein, partial [Deltaproteobacteria bacterium]
MRHSLLLPVIFLFIALSGCAVKERRTAQPVEPQAAQPDETAALALLEKASKEFKIRLDLKDAKAAKATLYMTAIGRMDKNPDNAVKILDTLMVLEPRRWDIHYNSGVICLRLKRYEKAEKEFLTALKHKGPADKIYNALGRLYLERGKLPNALDAFKNALKHEKSRTALINLANISLKTGQKEDALKYFRMLEDDMEAGPGDAAINYNMGVFLYKTGYNLKALERFNKAIELDPKHLPTLFAKAQSLIKLGRYEEALDAYKLVSELNPAD